ncbi:MAG: NUDIX domain-containing protein [Planctomycetales bacterium]|nr:NUDIX domain-containing protein [Planctomycetales bacterium]
MPLRGDQPARNRQACAVPYRHQAGQLEFCLITSSEGRWSFPKGKIDPGETATEAALKEAWEEAGLRGTLAPTPLGNFSLDKEGATLEVTAWLLEVTSCEAEWPEADRRQRRWLSAPQARQLIDRAGWRQMIEAALRQLEE